MLKYIISLLLLAMSASADTLKYNPFTNNLDITSSGSSSSGGGIVSPATFTWRNNYGMSASTFAVSSNTLLGLSTFYANGDVETAGDVTVHSYDNVRDSKLSLGQWQFKQIAGDGNLYLGRFNLAFPFAESAAITVFPNTGSGGELSVHTLSITELSLPLTPPGTFSLNIGQQAFQSQNTDGNLVLYDLINNRKYFELERDTANLNWLYGNIQARYGITASTFTFIGSSAPPNGYALCLSGGQVGHCTSVVGVGGTCTCAAP